MISIALIWDVGREKMRMKSVDWVSVNKRLRDGFSLLTRIGC